ncbi:MAG: stage II sporulation protein R [Clostridiales bacterium]|jgi:stage II sporulation protein R|nr:stage II sporulation protein R [Clostridiales bacterium]
MKIFFRRLGLAIMCGFAVLGIIVTAAQNSQKAIASNVFRLHVVADSDSIQDQSLKLKVRDGILEFLSEFDDARTAAAENLPKIQQIAQSIVDREGQQYGAQASIGEFAFPTKSYGDIALPAGKYDALRVTLGSGQGQNWWCVIYPNICIIGDSAAISTEGREQLQGTLSKGDFALVTGESPLKFRILELFKE